MEMRTNESPMDFQWQQGHGPASSDSPFMKAAANNTQQQSSFAGQKRPYNLFDSPSKPSLPSLREPANQTFLFPSTPSMKHPIQFRNSSFTTPQRPFETDFSSGPENHSSPANGDTEDTPEPPMRNKFSKPDRPVTKFVANRSPDKKKPSLGIFEKYASSGRGEIVRKPYSDVVARRVHKRRRRDAEKDVRLAHRRPSYDSDSGDPSRPSSSEGANQRPPPYKMGLIPSIFSFLEHHPGLPHVLAYYAQSLLNFFFVFLAMYLVYSFWSVIQADVNERSREVASEILVEMAVCAREYKDNRCDSNSRVPAMESVCNNWEKCMKRDPSMVGRARVSAHTFAEILNSFFEPIHLKTVILSLSILLGLALTINLPFKYFRQKVEQPLPPAAYMHPPTPQQTGYSGGGGDQYYQPYQNPTPHQNHQNHMGRRLSEHMNNRMEQESPVRRLEYR